MHAKEKYGIYLTGSYLYKIIEDKYKYIYDIYNTLILRDVNKKYDIRNKNLIDNLSNFLMDNISNLTSARNIAKTLTNNENIVNHKTIGKYIEYLCNAFAFYKVQRYDIQGKK